MIHFSNFYKIVENSVLDENISKGLTTRAYDTEFIHPSITHLSISLFLYMSNKCLQRSLSLTRYKNISFSPSNDKCQPKARARIHPSMLKMCCVPNIRKKRIGQTYSSHYHVVQFTSWLKYNRIVIIFCRTKHTRILLNTRHILS